MNLLRKIEALLVAVSPRDLAGLPPAELRRFADTAYSLHVLAERAAGGKPFPPVVRAAPRPQPKCGVLYELLDGRGQQ